MFVENCFWSDLYWRRKSRTRLVVKARSRGARHRGGDEVALRAVMDVGIGYDRVVPEQASLAPSSSPVSSWPDFPPCTPTTPRKESGRTKTR
jgi:hypothetical protein